VAVWQADFILVISRAWPLDYAARLDAVAARSRQLLPSTTTWGSDDGNRLDVYTKNERPADGLLRLDLRAWGQQFVEAVLGLLREWSCGLEDPGGRPVEPVLGEVALAAGGSPAFRFVEDPEAFFRRVRLGGLEDA
jgi:hypothetical protein